jgi:hypothetical protein
LTLLYYLGLPLKSLQPSSSPHFVGRDEQLKLLATYYQKRDPTNLRRRTGVIYGLGGVGKTQITVRFIEENSDLCASFNTSKQNQYLTLFLLRFTNIFWIDASSQDTIQDSLIAISSNSSATAAGVKPTVQSVLQWLAAKRDEWLLIFDGADHDPELISQFLPAMNRGNILISTRNPHMQSIAGMTYEIIDMSQQEAITLLLHSAGTGHDPNSRHDRELAAPIVDELCCLPLAVDSAGAAIMNRISTLSDYLSVYHKHLSRIDDVNIKNGCLTLGNAV